MSAAGPHRDPASVRRARQRGSESVEAAVGGVIFFVLLIGIMDLARLQYFRVTLRHAVSQGTRFATTGQTMDDPANPGTPLSRDASIQREIERLSVGITVPHDPIQITARDGAGNVVNGSGGPGDVVTVSITYHAAVLTPLLRNAFPGGVYTFTCSSSFKNEEFTTSMNVPPSVDASRAAA